MGFRTAEMNTGSGYDVLFPGFAANGFPDLRPLMFVNSEDYWCKYF